ncbi:F-box only protein 15 isoform X3 [Tamandua tetradactyla]|uniref:F-box only protein 15 isoform X3 n=1 Tax=Tamandua tetradactyla TaxID=48850 RepID=UPI004053B650
MATGRGRFHPQPQRSPRLGALSRPLGGVGVPTRIAVEAATCFGATLFRKGPGVKFTADSLKQYARYQKQCQKSSKYSVPLDSMPSEILLKIFSFLNAVTLLCIGCVNKRLYQLASDNLIWIRIYSTSFSPKRSIWRVNSVEKIAVSVSLLSVEDKETGYWKKEYIAKQIASVKAALAQILKPVNPYTGLPVKIKEALRVSGLGWVIILKDKSEKEYIMEHVDLSINDASVTVVWYSKNWPRLATLSTMDLCGVTPVFMDQHKVPTKNGPYELPPHSPCLDDDPEYGLQSYQLHVDMHSGGISYLCGTFHNLFSKKDYIENGYVKLIVISSKNNTQHLPLIGKVGLCWRTDIFEGCLKSCCVMDLTLLDESGKPFWCFSSPVCMRSSPRPSEGPNFLGQEYYVDYLDSVGKVHVELVWIEETEEYFIVDLALYLSVAKVNHWFGTKY